MRKITIHGENFRLMLLNDEKIEQNQIATKIGLANSTVSKEINSEKAKNHRHRVAIYEAYAERTLKPVSYDDFWLPQITLEKSAVQK